ncbi:molybdate ABC transporter permease subunit [Phenylobacterium immobile]|uniref:molybdate ABC transporter permease subunit n=1 Tax=Phenylobacterium immobile TaxID=21 RepID=UPI000AF8F011|nr:molybdate ABC transporter permease subunit [Phenylobacterium immobile]
MNPGGPFDLLIVALTTLRLAGLTTILLLLVATPLAWWLARSNAGWKEAVAAITALPLVLPPSVLGFYLLLALAPTSPLMALAAPFGVSGLAFTFPGLVVGSMVYSLPFAVQPIRNAFQALGDDPWDSAATLGAPPLAAFLRVIAPAARRGFLTAAVLVFAHTVGEFGVILMIGGAIPGETEVLSVRMYRLVESLRFGEAHLIAAAMVAFAFAVLTCVFLLDRRAARDRD